MFTDIVGYTALSQRNEPLALALLERHNHLLRPTFPRFRGREVKAMGDSFLVEFESALDATTCAIEIQRLLHDYNVPRRDPEQIRLRIGIHLGDVVHSAGDVFGDAVNIASRMEPLAEAGGICISQQVFDHIRNKVSNPLVKLAPTDLKNVEFPIDVYKIVLPWEKIEVIRDSSALDPTRRVAVLPFANMSPDPQDEFFADGLTEEITTELSRVPGLQVIARTSVMPYKRNPKSISEIRRELRIGAALEGSVRKVANRIRITAQLIDANTEAHLWTQRFDRELTDIFATQSEIAKNVARSLGVRLGKVGQRARRRTTDFDAYSLYLKGRFQWNRRTPESVRGALESFEGAIARDPDFAQAYSGVADCYVILTSNWEEIPWVDGAPRAKAAALRAIELDAELAEAHASLGLILSGDYEYPAAEEEFRRALGLDPGYAPAHIWQQQSLLDRGRFADAARELAQAEEADPLSPTVLLNLGSIAAFQSRDEEALRYWDRVMEVEPGFSYYVHFEKAIFYAKRSRMEEASASLAAFESLTTGGGSEPEVRYTWLPATIYGVLGREKEARQSLERLLKIAKNEYVSGAGIAMVYAALDDPDRFYDWIRRGIDDRSTRPGTLRISLLLEKMRSDPRFLDVLRRCGVAG